MVDEYIEKKHCFTCYHREGIIRDGNAKTLLCKECLAIPIEEPSVRVNFVEYKGKVLKISTVFNLLGYKEKRRRWFQNILKRNDYNVEETVEYFKGRDNADL